jgi:hypothetical protein
MAILMLPVPLSGSNSTFPLVLSKRPRWIKKPRWLISKLGKVCFGSTVYKGDAVAGKLKEEPITNTKKDVFIIISKIQNTYLHQENQPFNTTA